MNSAPIKSTPIKSTPINSEPINSTPINSTARPAISYFFNASKDGDTFAIRSKEKNTEDLESSQITDALPSQIANIIKFKPTFGKKNIPSTIKKAQSTLESTIQDKSKESSSEVPSEISHILPRQVESFLKVQPNFATRYHSCNT